jgi:anti-sigma B factor antagonist
MISAVPSRSRSVTAMHNFEHEPVRHFAGSARSRRSHLSLAVEPSQSAAHEAASTFTVDLRTAKQSEPDTAVVTVRGEIDITTAPVLIDALLPVLEDNSGPVVIDLSAVPFMDSTGVQLLVDTLRRLRPHGRRLTIACREGGQVHRVLALVGLLDALSVHRSLESAVIGGEALLRPEPRNNGSAAAAPALTHSAPVHR